MIEIWAPVPGHPRYEVSGLGRVRSATSVIKYANGRTRRQEGRVLSVGNPEGDDYVAVNLCDGIGGREKVRVHRLVAEVFIGPCPQLGLEVCHNDGDFFNNTASNLRWGTRGSNNLDQVIHGTHPHASKTHCLRGHEFTPENTRDNGKGGRSCLACRRLRYVPVDERRPLHEWLAGA